MPITIPLTEPTAQPWQGHVMLASGHRPFFLFSALWAAGGLALWLAAWQGLLPLDALWHGHEMLFGFAGAAIAGFLMAAVPKWTNRPSIQGMPLLGLILLFLAGRLGMMAGGAWAWLDLLFLPALAAFIARDIWIARNRRNYQVPAMLLGLAGLNAWFHFGDPVTALHVMAYLITAMIVLIGGRIVPAFTQNALRMATGDHRLTCHTPAWLDRLAVPSVMLVVVTEILLPGSLWSGLAALFAAILLLIRMKGWQSRRVLGMPLVWILHVGYLWVPLGYLLKAAADLAGMVPPSAALHALTTGAIGVMILAVASRAALGHSGRPLRPSPATVLAYGLVILAALLRVSLPLEYAILPAGILWTAGWALFAVVYWPILVKPRIDGLPG
ncbi:NnrS family protein [Telmatospirillum sp. J64-1]|uniref:NnrS family protein n=1 Tax=Telmatospirillum sp. J64-1 TaxID=2502183 RepID=UPI00115E022C|nr:NnrS family protein [Telmatospirillum sp. J64-1]